MHHLSSKANIFNRLCLFILLILSVSSCIPNRELIYFPNPAFNTSTLTPIASNYKNYKLQPRDVLSVKVKSLDAESSDYFNLQDDGNFNMTPASVYINGYSINEKGEIEIPGAGAINVGGLTITEAQRKVQAAVGSYLTNATILVKLVSFKITVLGEVKNPGYYYVYNDQATVLEGLGMAGDLTEFGNRENITLIRQGDNKMGGVLVNLKDPKVLSSEFYYLQPNDVVYVQPLKAKSSRSNLNTLSVLSLAFGAVSSAMLILNYVK